MEVVSYAMSDHEITLLVVNRKVKAKPPVTLLVGQTVRYTAPNGKLRIEFPDGSPYDIEVVEDSLPHTIIKAGRYTGHCFVKLDGETEELGWSPGDNDAGVNHDVENPPPPPS